MAYSLIADDMAVFAKVVEAQGFTAAARVLGVPKVSVSRAVARLERALATRLLERTTRRIALTATGRAVLAHCQRVLLEMEGARLALAAPPPGASLRVGVDAAYGRLLVAPLVPRFLERFPDVALELVTLEEGTGAGACDVRLRSGDAAGADESAFALGTPALVLCASAGWVAAHGQPRFPSELGGQPLLGSFEAAEPVLRLSKDGGVVALRVSPRLNSPDAAAVQAAVAAGLGIAVLPEFLCRNGLATRRLVRLLPDWTVLDGPVLAAICPAARAKAPEVRSFVDFLAASLVPALAAPVESTPSPS